MFLRYLPVIALAVVACTGNPAFASTKGGPEQHAVPALAGKVYSPPPPSGNSDADLHIHMSRSDIYYSNHPEALTPASGSLGGWGAAGAGAPAVVASGPPAVYTTMAAASAAGIKPFSKPDAAGKKVAALKAPKARNFKELGFYAALGLGVLASLIMVMRKRRGRRD
jgi:hypothetical protein